MLRDLIAKEMNPIALSLPHRNLPVNVSVRKKKGVEQSYSAAWGKFSRIPVLSFSTLSLSFILIK